ncbi:unnamed protein product [Vitrella brassicaformis CCMP3155]|uniref:Uncharacterized protein n=1 Tax=Vitrella brassicaformis (strain CCMP3155) TaxID=1169540 RepID=A0A0G4GSN7_VITBC|nr:unnamed protein product [Vitrella brassicaformis CCMP3155]|eukprot:CEM33702.1 unnamed protein product [Vitrella brassicaformis CCMP3155]
MLASLADVYRTDVFQRFSEHVAVLRRNRARPFCLSASAPDGTSPILRVKTFFDLSSFDFKNIMQKEQFQSQPGSLLLIWMFYSRLYTKLIEEALGHASGTFFAPIDLDERHVCFREILDFARDFDMFGPSVGLTKVQLERAWQTIAPVLPEYENHRFKAKVTFDEFVDYLTVLGDVAMSHPRWNLQHYKRSARVLMFFKQLGLYNVKAVKARLLDAYRDTHIHRFKAFPFNPLEMPKRAFLLAMPKGVVLMVPEEKRLNVLRDDALKRFIERRFVWLDQRTIWEAFEGPWIDMGVQQWNVRKSYRMDITNLNFHSCYLNVSVEHCDPVRVTYKTTPLPPGATVQVMVDSEPTCCGEWLGFISIDAITARGDWERVGVPIYLRTVMPGTHPRAEQLPMHAPSPFQKKGVHDVTSGLRRTIEHIDPTSTSNLVARRPGSAQTSEGRHEREWLMEQEQQKQTKQGRVHFAPAPLLPPGPPGKIDMPAVLPLSASLRPPSRGLSLRTSSVYSNLAGLRGSRKVDLTAHGGGVGKARAAQQRLGVDRMLTRAGSLPSLPGPLSPPLMQASSYKDLHQMKLSQLMRSSSMKTEAKRRASQLLRSQDSAWMKDGTFLHFHD